MTFLPVVAREMTALARRKSTYLARSLMVIGSILVIGWLVLAASAVSTAQQGRIVFLILSSIAFAYAVLAGVQATSDCLSEEKREGTLGLLFLTDLKSYDIVLGKMAAGSLNAAFALLAIMPVLSLAMLLGGVSVLEIVQSACVLGMALVLSLSVSVFISSISTNERKAMFASAVTLGVLTFGPFFAALIISNFKNPSEKVTFPSPLYAFLCVWTAGGTPTPFNSSYFWWSLFAQASLSALCFQLASKTLPRFVNDLPQTRWLAIKEIAQRLTYGNKTSRKQHRAALLDRNAFLWLASRERIKPRYAWLIIALFALLYAWVLIIFPAMFFELPVALLICFLIHLSFKLWTASEVSSRLIQDRRSGALELLLTSPLTEREIAHGQTLALRRIFFWPVAFLIIAELILMAAILRRVEFNGPQQSDILICFFAVISTLLLDLWALKWTALWLSLYGKSIERVFIVTVARIMSLPWVIFVVIGGVFVVSRGFMGKDVRSNDILIAWWLFSALPVLAFALPARHKFLRTFREAAGHRFTIVSDEIATVETKPVGTPFAPAKQKPRRRFIPAWGTLLVIVFCLFAARRFYWESKFNREVRAIEADGLPSGLHNSARYYPPLAAKENAIAIIKQAGTVNLAAFGKRFNVGSGFGLVGVNRMSEDMRRSFDQIAKLNSNQLAQFVRAASMPKAYLEPAVESLWSFPQDIQSYAVLAWVDGVLAVEKGDLDGAVRSTTNLLKYAALLRAQPASSAQSACALAIDRASHIWERTLYFLPVDEGTLARVAAEIDRVEQAASLPSQIIMRRAIILTRFRSPGLDLAMFGPASPAVSAVNGLLSGIGSQWRSHYNLLLAYRQGIAAASLPAPERLNRAAQLDRLGAANLTDIPIYLRPAYEMTGTFTLDASITARIHLMQLATAMERFRAAGKHLPEFTEIPSVPSDPFTGQPLKFKREKSECLLYSIGVNQKDENGRRGEYQNGDIVFSLRVE